MIEILENIGMLLLLVVALALVFIMGVAQYNLVFGTTMPALSKLILPRRLEARYKIHIAKNLSFYKYLGPKSRIKFERRVQQFINLKEFIPRGKDMLITDEMKALIAGTAVMVGFGHPGIYLSHFKKILLYNNNYYSTITKQYHKGEVNMRGYIVLSWQAFRDGFIDKKDGINLGIHEMAHALRFENRIMNDEYGFLNPRAIRKFDHIALEEIALRNTDPDRSSVLRDYSISNKEEFFAVAAELFFEDPLKLLNYSPDLYYLLVPIFKIDTLKMLKHAG
ncbi:MAG: zinc-dependent peptidase [Marinilabiliaceae bacterium]|jgi:Mlc titration factor MtfA (ptsG expression regulator)|nr:zinc-dependent peptidase [Marinilabiliaceae bacterium]